MGSPLGGRQRVERTRHGDGDGDEQDPEDVDAEQMRFRKADDCDGDQEHDRKGGKRGRRPLEQPSGIAERADQIGAGDDRRRNAELGGDVDDAVVRAGRRPVCRDAMCGSSVALARPQTTP